jgi:type IV pilus assembly protein PilC
MKFKFQARTKTGKTKKGILEAPSKEAAILILQKEGLFPIFVEEAKPSFFERINFFSEKVSDRDLILVFRELATLFRAGIPFIEALETIAKETTNKRIYQIFSRLKEEVAGGATFSDALSLYPDVFSSFIIYTVKSGEISGNLAQTLEALSDTLERNYLFANKVRDSLLYPGLVVSLAILVVLLMLFVVLPNLAQKLLQFEMALPPLLSFFVGLGNFLKNWGIIIFFLFFLFIFSVVWYFKTEEGRKTLSRYIIFLPFFGNIFKMIYLARFAENFGSLLSRGLPVAESIEISADLVGNVVYKEAFSIVRDGVKAGEPISSLLEKFPDIFPPFYVQLISVGERSGNLSRSLSQLSNFYQKEVERTLSTFTTLLEPILIVGIGIFIGLIIFLVLNIIYQIVGSVGA